MGLVRPINEGILFRKVVTWEEDVVYVDQALL